MYVGSCILNIYMYLTFCPSPSPCDYRPQSSTTDTGELLADTCCVFLPPSVSKQLLQASLTTKCPHPLTPHSLTPSPSRGMSPASAELVYIKLAQQLPEYGHESFQTLVGGHWPPSLPSSVHGERPGPTLAFLTL